MNKREKELQDQYRDIDSQLIEGRIADDPLRPGDTWGDWESMTYTQKLEYWIYRQKQVVIMDKLPPELRWYPALYVKFERSEEEIVNDIASKGRPVPMLRRLMELVVDENEQHFDLSSAEFKLSQFINYFGMKLNLGARFYKNYHSSIPENERKLFERRVESLRINQKAEKYH